MYQALSNLLKYHINAYYLNRIGSVNALILHLRKVSPEEFVCNYFKITQLTDIRLKIQTLVGFFF